MDRMIGLALKRSEFWQPRRGVVFMPCAACARPVDFALALGADLPLLCDEHERASGHAGNVPGSRQQPSLPSILGPRRTQPRPRDAFAARIVLGAWKLWAWAEGRPR
jgi:hypothetical protein